MMISRYTEQGHNKITIMFEDDDSDSVIRLVNGHIEMLMAILNMLPIENTRK